MPSFNVTLEDTSPMLRFSGNEWGGGKSETDALASDYSQTSFTVTSTQGATMALDYYGSNITIHGSKRFNHGNFSLQLDKGSPISLSGLAPGGQNNINEVIFTAEQKLGSHNIVLTNTQSGSFLDVDYITFTTSVGENDEELIVNTFQDTHPSFQYTPSTSWTSPTDRMGWFSGSTGHVTTDSNAVARLIFQVGAHLIVICDAITVYGPVGPEGTDEYTVEMDNNPSTTYSARAVSYKPQEVLFFVGNLGPGNHSLQMRISSSSTTPGGQLAIDYVNVFTSESLGGSFLRSEVSAIDAPLQVREANKSVLMNAVIGLAVISALLLVTTLTFMHLLFREKRINRSSRKYTISSASILQKQFDAEKLSGTMGTSQAQDTVPIPFPKPSLSTVALCTQNPGTSNTTSETVQTHFAPLPSPDNISVYPLQAKRATTHRSIHARLFRGRSREVPPPLYTSG